MERELVSKALLAICAALILQACGSRGVVADSDRDDTGTYDGVYEVSVSKMASLQLLQNWQLSCSGEAFTMRVNVEGGQVLMQDFNQEAIAANVAKDGRFQVEIPLDDTSASGQSDVALADGRRKWILTGNLDSGTGRLVIGISQFAWQGCQTKVNYSKQT